YIDAGFSPKNARANASALLQNNPRIVERCDQLLRTRAECNLAVVSGIAVQEHCNLGSTSRKTRPTAGYPEAQARPGGVSAARTRKNYQNQSTRCVRRPGGFWTYVQQRGFQEREIRTGVHVEL